ncbi:MAG TPA: hypothetical protein DGR79_05280 [Clostridiales bacterium]|nr:hypothetical protein [Clostridiales bacterium]
MGLLFWSFLRRGWLRAVAAGVAVGLTLIAVLSYRVIGGEMSGRLTWGLSGGMPADGYVILHTGEFTPDDQARIAGMPGVRDCEFTPVANVILPTGPGQVEGVDFASPFFKFGLSQGRLPSGRGEAVVDSVSAQMVHLAVGSVIEAINAHGEPFTLTIVGVLSPAARAPSGLLVDRSYCLSPEVGGSLNRVWITVTPDTSTSATEVARTIAAGFAHADYATREMWSVHTSEGITVGQGILASLVGVLALSTMLVLWVLGQLYFSHGALSIRTCYALGVSSGGLRWLALADASLSGVVAAAVLGVCLALRPAVADGLVIDGPWCLVIVAAALPVLTTFVLSLAMDPATAHGRLAGRLPATPPARKPCPP